MSMSASRPPFIGIPLIHPSGVVYVAVDSAFPKASPSRVCPSMSLAPQRLHSQLAPFIWSWKHHEPT